MKITSQYLLAAKQILEETGYPLTAKEILYRAISEEKITTRGATPLKTLVARLSTEILNNKSESIFMRSDAGRFALREWSRDIQERIVPRRVVALFDEDILAFDAKLLRKFITKEGISRGEESHQELLASCFSVRRAEAELRYDIIQLISVYVVRYEQSFLTYKRSKRLPEGRLHNYYSCFFGGHLTSNDLMPLFRFGDPEQALYLLDRELSEELRLERKPRSMAFKGLLYDPRTQVSTQHVGIVFCVDLADKAFQIGEKGFLTDPKFESIHDMEARISDFENWSEFLIKNELRKWN